MRGIAPGPTACPRQGFAGRVLIHQTMIRDAAYRNNSVLQQNENPAFICGRQSCIYNTNRIVSILPETTSLMYDHARAVDLIEKSVDARPFCSCGRHTTPVWRDGVVWLECSSLGDPREGVIAGFVAAATAPAHVRTPIIDVLEDGLPLAA